jgi:lambda family phage tail tape measure protein
MAKKAQIDIVARDRASGQIKQVSRSAAALTSSLGTVAAAAVVAGAAMAGVVSIAIDARKAFQAQKDAIASMETAMRSMGRFSAIASEQLQNLAKALQRVTNFGDEATLSAVGFLMTYKGITDDLMPRTIKVMQDLAAKMGGGPGSLRNAANMMGKASMGMTGDLRRAGITVESSTFKAEGYLGLLRDIEEQVSGMAAALVDPWKQLHNNIGDAKETLGAFVAIAFDDWARDANLWLQRLNDGFDELTEKMKEAERVTIRAQIRMLESMIETERAVADMGGIGADFEIKMESEELFEAEKHLADLRKQLGILDKTHTEIHLDKAGEAWELFGAAGIPEAITGGAYKPPLSKKEKKDIEKAAKIRVDMQMAAGKRMRATLIKQYDLEVKLAKDGQDKIIAEYKAGLAKVLLAHEKAYAKAKESAETFNDEWKAISVVTVQSQMALRKEFHEKWAALDKANKDAQLQRDKDQLEEQKRIDREAAESKNQLLIDHGTALQGMSQGLREWGQEAGSTFEQYTELARNAADMVSDRLSTAIHDVIMGTKTWQDAFREMAVSIMSDIAKMIIKMLVLKAIQASMGYMGFTGSLFASTAHSGGVVGSTSFPQRRVSASTFMGAPRLHDGLAGDEFPAILQRGETVLPRGASMSAQGTNITTNVTINSEGGGFLGKDEHSDDERKSAGMQIAKIVNTQIDKRLQTQMRPGGMLNRT